MNAPITRETPILFGGPMVRRILDGTKTQTRRLVKGTALEWLAPDMFAPSAVASPGNLLSPYGYAGDRLWVRETWRTDTVDPECGVRFRADDAFTPIANTRDAAEAWVDAHENGKHGEKWRPSIFIRRWASRTTLEIASLRLERLQDITVEDARAEGLSRITKDGTLFKYGIPDRDGFPGTDDDGQPWREWKRDPREAFAGLWNSINAKRAPWSANPWVWVIGFRRLP